MVKPGNKDKLTAILLLHVVPGKTVASDITDKVNDPATAGGRTVHVGGTQGATVNDATIVTANIKCSNGVIHVLDAVLLPKK